MNTIKIKDLETEGLEIEKFHLHLHCLRTMKTPALARTIETMEKAQETATSEGHFTLECLLEYARQELETRRDSYTGEYDS